MCVVGSGFPKKKSVSTRQVRKIFNGTKVIMVTASPSGANNHRLCFGSTKPVDFECKIEFRSAIVLRNGSNFVLQLKTAVEWSKKKAHPSLWDVAIFTANYPTDFLRSFLRCRNVANSLFRTPKSRLWPFWLMILRCGLIVVLW